MLKDKNNHLGLLKPDEIRLLKTNTKWMKVVLELWGETRDGKPKEQTEYGYYYSLREEGIISFDEFNKLESMIK